MIPAQPMIIRQLTDYWRLLGLFVKPLPNLSVRPVMCVEQPVVIVICHLRMPHHFSDPPYACDSNQAGYDMLRLSIIGGDDMRHGRSKDCQGMREVDSDPCMVQCI